jgi:hypothetical protein
MSEFLAERLSRFTPDSSRLDRDALFFAAGRASARPVRAWAALAGALAASQLLMLVLLWPSRPLPPRLIDPIATKQFTEPPGPVERDPMEMGMLARSMLQQSESDLPREMPVPSLIANDPPLRAFSATEMANVQ